LLDALHHPFYDESYLEKPHGRPSSLKFSPEVWTAILSAHVHLGLINSSRFILESMQANGIQPRPEDMSAIICGLAKSDLEAAHDLAIKLANSVTIEAYETLLKIGLERGHSKIIEWAKGLVARERPVESWVQPHIPNDEPVEYAFSFAMKSELQVAMAEASIPTCTPRAIGTLITHIAKTKGIPEAIVQLSQSSMRFPREVYDELYGIALERNLLSCAMWLANEMRKRGWIPYAYAILKHKYNRRCRRLRKTFTIIPSCQYKIE